MINKILLTITLVIIINTIFSFIYYSLREGYTLIIDDKIQDPTFLDCFYLSNSNFFTLGFSDMHPISDSAKITSIFHSYLAYIITIFGTVNLLKNMIFLNKIVQ